MVQQESLDGQYISLIALSHLPVRLCVADMCMLVCKAFFLQTVLSSQTKPLFVSVSTFCHLGCYDGALYCICTVSGNIEWAFTTGAMIKCTPALCNEGRSVLFGSYDYNVYCVSAEVKPLLH